MKRYNPVSTITVCVVMLLTAIVIVLTMSLCYHPSAASESDPSGFRRPIVSPPAAVEPLAPTATPTTEIREPKEYKYFRLDCQQAEGRNDGNMTVALEHDGKSYFYPGQTAANEGQRAASVIKLQVVACYLDSNRVPDIGLCRRAIKQSDNDAANELIDAVGIETVNQWCEIQGYADTKLMRRFNMHFEDGQDHGYNQTSVADQVKFLRALWEGRILTASAREQMLGWMLGNERRTKIPRHFGKEYDVYNKTGETWEVPVQNDVAIVTKDGDVWFLAILTHGSPLPDAEVSAGIADLAKTLISSF